MSPLIAEFLSLVSTALVSGSMFGLWLGLNPAGLAASFYIAQQQQLVRRLNVVLPAMGALATVTTLSAAYVARQQPVRLSMLVAGAAALFLAGMITRLRNQPVNAVMITLTPESPPAHWQDLRDTWWSWHVARTAAGLFALCSVVAAHLYGK